jgi:protein-S-isoprenylcysteine O-methyltransferase Ste14/uncharacterized membrane protein
MPLFTVVFAHFATRDERFSRKKIAGVALGLAGVVLLMGPSVLKGLGSHVLGQLAVAGAAASYAVAAIYGKRLGKDTPFILATGQMTAGALLISPFMIVVDKPWTLSPDMPAIFCLLLLAVTNTALAYVLYYKLLAHVGATRLSLVTYIIPISGVFWGWLVLGERLGWTAFAALGLILASVATVSDLVPERNGNGAGFDPFGWAAALVSEEVLHRVIRIVMTVGCAVFLAKRALEYDQYWVKPLWAAETAIYVVLLIAFLFRTQPVDRSRGMAEILIPLAGAVMPFALLFSSPARFVWTNRAFNMGIFWFMAAATALTVWGMWSLRRSFSITVEAREFIKGGPYRFVRHPIYTGEILAAAAVTFWRASWSNLVVFTLFLSLQLVRARMEEEKLKRNFPAYEDYAGDVWWIWR